MSDDPAKQAWQSTVAVGGPLPLDQLRRNADKFYRLIRLRNRIEFAACLLVVVVFTAYAFLLPVETVRVGAATVVGGTFVVAWQLHRRASALVPPDEALAAATLAHQRAQMVRQRDALASVFYWYLLPFMPGLLLMIFGAAIEQGFGILGHLRWNDWGAVSLTAALFVFVWWLNRRAARKLQKGIEEIDALTGGNGS
jgi:hypothetical protein